MTLAGVLEAVRTIRTRSQLPLLLFSYFNPLLRYGLDRLAREAKEAGVDGVLVTDLPPEEAGDWLALAAQRPSRHRVPGRPHQPAGASGAGGGGEPRLHLRGEPHRRDRRAGIASPATRGRWWSASRA